MGKTRQRVTGFLGSSLYVRDSTSKEDWNMTAPRQTFQQRLFADDELPLQSHDRIVRWSDKTLRENASAFLTALSISHEISSHSCIGWGAEVIWDGLEGHWNSFSGPLRSLARRYAPEKPQPPAIEASNVVWEPILKDERGTIIGAVDLFAILKIPTLELEISSCELGFNSRTMQSNIVSSVPEDGKFLFWDGQRVLVDGQIREIRIQDTFPDGIIGIIANKTSARALVNVAYAKVHRYDEIRLYVEAKTKIRSIGELMRQLNLYRSVVRSGSRFLVVAPSMEWDSETKAILHEQGIATVDYLAN